MRRDDREIAELHFRTEQRLEQPNQERAREHFRSAECAGHARRDVLARIPDHEEPVRRRFRGFSLHCGQIQRAKLRDKLVSEGASAPRNSTQPCPRKLAFAAAALVEDSTPPAVSPGETATVKSMGPLAKWPAYAGRRT
jgi:hypothetical protein